VPASEMEMISFNVMAQFLKKFALIGLAVLVGVQVLK